MDFTTWAVIVANIAHSATSNEFQGCLSEDESHIDTEYVLLIFYEREERGFSKLIGSIVTEIMFEASRPGLEVLVKDISQCNRIIFRNKL